MGLGPDQVSEAFVLMAKVALKDGAGSIKDRPGCYERTVGDWWFAINGGDEDRECSRGAKVPAFHAYLEWNGWPAGVTSPFDGTIIAGGEDALIAALKAELAAPTSQTEG